MKRRKEKRVKKEIPRIRGTYYLSESGIETTETRGLILRRRLQILIHSYLYYEEDVSLISDNTWDKWAQELATLQKDYPRIASRVDYYEYFKGFDGSTGFNLPYRLPEIVRKAKQLIEFKSEGV